MQKILWCIGLTLVLVACGASQKIQESNTALDEMMAQKAFKIQMRAAHPMVTQAWSQIANSGLIQQGNSPGRIDLAGSGYFIKVKGDSVSAKLPYFGERRLGGGYNLESGINFDGITENLVIEKDEVKKSHSIDFIITDQTEVYNVSMVVDRKLGGMVYILSSHRSRIWYSGSAMSLKDKQP